MVPRSLPGRSGAGGSAELPLGRSRSGFASGTVALNLDWAGWAGFFNDPASSKVVGNVAAPPTGSLGERTGWSGFHGFFLTEACDAPEAATSLVWSLTIEESQIRESAAGPLPSRSAVWDHIIAEAEGDEYRSEVLQAFQNPELQDAILGDKTAQEALDEGARQATMILEDAGEL